MASFLKRFDDGVARGEGAVAAFILLVMILLAALQALLYNLAERAGWLTAQDLLLELGWIDQVLQKGTLWLAFLGASLATHKDQHIAIDALQRLLPGRLRYAIKALVALASTVSCYFLARVFFNAALAAQERPLEYELLGDSGPIHICAGTAQQLAEVELSKPAVFCAARDALSALGAPVQTPTGALQLIVPAMFLWMSVRFGARIVTSLQSLLRGDGDGHVAPAERAHAEQAQ